MSSFLDDPGEQEQEPRKMSIWLKIDDDAIRKIDNLSTGTYARMRNSNKAVLDYIQENRIADLNEQVRNVYKSLDGVHFYKVVETNDSTSKMNILPDCICDECIDPHVIGSMPVNEGYNLWFRLNDHPDEVVENLTYAEFKKLKNSNKEAAAYAKTNFLHTLQTYEPLMVLFRSIDGINFDRVLVPKEPSDENDDFEELVLPDPKCLRHDLNEGFKIRLQAFRHNDDTVQQNPVDSSSVNSTSNTVLQCKSNTQDIPKGKKSSAIWMHCEKKIGHETRIHCNYCKKTFAWNNNTSNMMNHLSTKHEHFFQKENSTQNQACPPPEKKICLDKPKNVNAISGIKAAFENLKNFRVGGSKEDEITNAILYMICVDSCPIDTVDKRGFKFLMKKLCPLYEPPSRFTMTRRLEAKYVVMKQRVEEVLESVSNYCITADNWTDSSNQSYMGVTVHYLEEKTLIFKKICLGCIPLYERHTAEYLEKAMRDIFMIFNIDISKIGVLLTDAEPAVKKAAIAIVTAKRDIACIAHSASHVLPDAVKVSLEVGQLIDKVKSIVVLIRRSINATDKLLNCQVDDTENKKVTSKKNAVVLTNDCPTRWTSTTEMLERYVELERYIFTAMSACTHPIDILSREEVKQLSDILEIMKPFQDVITEISGKSYPTCSLIIPILHCLKITVDSYSPVTDVGQSLKAIVKEKMKDRFGEFEQCLVLSCATVLDPRFKKIHFENKLACAKSISELDNQLKTMKPAEKCPEESIVQQNCSLWQAHDALLKKQKNIISEMSAGGLDSELESYLKLPHLACKENIFMFWKLEESNFPNLSKIAFQRLSSLATTVPSERQFSTAGIINTPNRNQLTEP